MRNIKDNAYTDGIYNDRDQSTTTNITIGYDLQNTMSSGSREHFRAFNIQ